MKQCSDPETGDPIQYDELRIEHEEGTVDIVVYDRAIVLFTTESEGVRGFTRCVAGSMTSLRDAAGRDGPGG